MSEYRKVKSLKFLYEVNEDGVIRNVKSKKILKGYRERNGYIRVKFENKCLGGTVRVGVHQIVAEVFIPNPDNLPEVNHKNSDRSDNRACNLEWVSHSENMAHAYHEGMYKEGVAKGLRTHSESERKKVTNGIATFESLTEAGRWLAERELVKNQESGISGISQVCRGKIRSCGGFNWYYI